ncbi:unnamed protein product [Caenorhabditis nigoni]
MLHKTTLLFLALALIGVAFGEDGGATAAYNQVSTGPSVEEEVYEYHYTYHYAGFDPGVTTPVGPEEQKPMEESQMEVHAGEPETIEHRTFGGEATTGPSGGDFRTTPVEGSATFVIYGIGASLVLLAAL